MKIALIGGAGFIGHHLALELKKWHEPYVLDSLMVNNWCALQENRAQPWGPRYLKFINQRMELLHEAEVPFKFCDARDYHGLSKAFRDISPEVVIHLAAVAHIDRSKKDPFSTFDHSLRTLENSLDASHAVGVKHFVYFSSSTVYGNFPKPTVNENEVTKPIGTYGSLKLAGELMVKAYHNDKGLDYTIIRPQALYGPRCVSRRVTQLFIENAIDGKPLSVEGDGSAAHDFTHVGDVVSGISEIINQRGNSLNQTFCLTAGAARTLKDLAEIVQGYIPCEIHYGPPNPDKPSRGTMSVWKAKRLLGWKPKYHLESGMADYISWYRNFMKGSSNATEIR